MGSLGVHRDIARGAVKGDAVLGFDNPKAFGNAIHPYIERVIHLRKLGSAGLIALRTVVVFNPMLAGRHPTNMHLRLLRSTSICRPQSKFEKREFLRCLEPLDRRRGPLLHLRADHAERQGGRQPRVYV